MAAPYGGCGDAVAAPRMEASLELRARTLLVLRRYKEVALLLVTGLEK